LLPSRISSRSILCIYVLVLCLHTNKDIYNYESSAVAEMGGRLATLDIGRKVGAAVSIYVGGKLGLHLTKCGLGQGLPPYQVAS